ncbi:MAG: rRNA pseudouridine synthase [Defluviitaleaceae bacterium]|nr:rRNA pseudouridine synthase [Defluviitaleaceae bacterium]MCL2264232.1 rRNA pseudouridine synthase [Defluviitaleaceae bacterium]
MEIRLQKILANAGVASRRKSEELIAEGRVTVNGIVITELGAKAKTKDKIEVDGVPVGRAPRKKTYIMLHKPEGVVTTVADQFDRPTVMDYLPADRRLFPVGRLDYETSGLIFLTNDGDWANALTHPKSEIRKTYIAEIKGEPTEAELKKFREGIKLTEKDSQSNKKNSRKTAPAEIEILRTKIPTTKVRITIHEGRNRQVRRMCDAIGHPVKSLKRVSIGDVKLGDLPQGKWRHLTEGEKSNLTQEGAV